MSHSENNTVVQQRIRSLFFLKTLVRLAFNLCCTVFEYTTARYSQNNMHMVPVLTPVRYFLEI